MDMLDGAAEACAWLPCVSLVLRGTWMHPNPIGDVSEGMDTSFDEGDTCHSCRNGPWVRGSWLGGMPGVLDSLGIIGTVSDVCMKAWAHPLACETHPLGMGTCHRARD